MNKEDILLLGLKARVTATSRTTGQQIWSTALPGGMGHDFVTLLNDGERIFAHSKGQLHALDLASGQILWSNELSGYGYGLASLAFPGGPSAPDPQAVKHLLQQQANGGAGAGAGGAGGGA